MMSPGSSRSAVLVFLGLVCTMCALVTYVAAHEPVLHDVWYFRVLNERLSVSEYLEHMYWRGDPRLGGFFMYLLAADSWLHVLWTPIALGSCLFALFVLALGRWPRPHALHDSVLVVLLFGLYWIAVPHAGVMTFYRPFAATYVHSFTVLALFLVPYRLALAADPPFRRGWTAPAMLLAGVVAGFSNEHTVPTAIVAVCSCLWLIRRRRVRSPAWMVAGLVGLVAGFLLLFFAPAQDLRYGGLAGEKTIVERILDRGFYGNIAQLGMVFRHVSGAVALLVGALALARWRRLTCPPDELRRRLATAGVLALAALTITLTMLASPLQGYRLRFAATALLIAATLVAFDWLARDRAVRRSLVAIALVVSTLYGAQLVRVYRTADLEFRARMKILDSAAPGSRVVAPAYSRVEPDEWFFGDEFRDGRIRRNLLRTVWQLPDVEYVRQH